MFSLVLRRQAAPTTVERAGHATREEERATFASATTVLSCLAGCSSVINGQTFRPTQRTSGLEWTGRLPEVVTAVNRRGAVLRGLLWRSTAGEAPFLVFFHGRSGNQFDAGYYVQPLVKAGYAVLVASYEGYGGNVGVPSEPALADDADAFVALAKSLAPAPPVLVGHSLGGPIALGAAVRNPGVGGVVTIGGIADLRSAAPVFARPFVPRSFSSIDTAGRQLTPIVLFKGREDELVSDREAMRVLKRAPPGSLLVVAGEQSHRPDMRLVADFMPAMLAVLARRPDWMISTARAWRDLAVFRAGPSTSGRKRCDDGTTAEKGRRPEAVRGSRDQKPCARFMAHLLSHGASIKCRVT